MKAIFIFLSAIFFLSTPTDCLAWGMQGHRITGQIAYNHLTGKARRQIKELLGRESMAIATNWADFIKSDSSFDYIGSWHYINVKTGVDSSSFMEFIEGHHIPNIYQKIGWLSSQLKRKDIARDSSAFYLRLLIHFVGDIHQPMHVGRPEDLGGNRVQLLWFNTPTNLHRLWDEQLIEFQKLSYTEYAAELDKLSRKEIRDLQRQPLKQWVWNSYQIAEDIYRNVTPNEKLGFQYNYNYVSVLNQQLLTGGIHLAGMLNEIFS